MHQCRTRAVGDQLNKNIVSTVVVLRYEAIVRQEVEGCLGISVRDEDFIARVLRLWRLEVVEPYSMVTESIR